MRQRRTVGFTLIELLVVIAIIAILAAILFPVFAQARSKGRQSSSLSNLKQICMALKQYEADNDGFFPAITSTWVRESGFNPSKNPGPIMWFRVINPYVKNKQVFLDPGRGHQHAYQRPEWQAGLERFEVDYGMNLYMWLKNINTARMVAYPAEIMLVGECSHTHTGLYSSTSYRNFERPGGMVTRFAFPKFKEEDFPTGGNAPIPDYAWERFTNYNGGSNIAFMDGHAKWFNARDISDVYYGGKLRGHNQTWWD